MGSGAVMAGVTPLAEMVMAVMTPAQRIAAAVALIEGIGEPGQFPAIMEAGRRIHGHALNLARAEFDRGAV